MSESRFFPRYKKTCIGKDARLHDALKAISLSGSLVACVLEDNETLLGIVTDSDIRQALLHGASLEDSVLKWVNRNPTVASDTTAEEELHQLAYLTRKREFPILDAQNRLVDLFVLGLYEKKRSLNEEQTDLKVRELSNFVFILAGGKGTRLQSVVADRPKPLALINDKPILAILMDKLMKAGFRNYYVSINFMADQVREFFKAPQYSALNVQFVEESMPLGTAGSLAYVQNEVKEPLLVCNADVLTNIAFDRVMEHHQAHSADVTCVVRSHTVSIPYGVVEIQQGLVAQVKEKPQVSYLINSGIYVLSPSVCQIPILEQYLDMPQLLETALQKGSRVVPFMLHEYWLDVGLPVDYKRANEEYERYFGDNIL